MADHAWAAVAWPVEYGGRDATLLEQMVYVEQTVRAGAPMPINIIGMNNIAPSGPHFPPGSVLGRRVATPRGPHPGWARPRGALLGSCGVRGFRHCWSASAPDVVQSHQDPTAIHPGAGGGRIGDLGVDEHHHHDAFARRGLHTRAQDPPLAHRLCLHQQRL